MKPLLISGLLLLLLLSASLVGNRGNLYVLDETKRQAASVLPSERIKWTETEARTLTGRAFQFLAPQMRQKALSRAWAAVELVVLRGLLVWHMLPVFPLAVLIGLLEGFNARHNQQALVKIHSPMWFGSALLSLAFLPILAALWIVVPVAAPASLVVLLVFVVSTLACRNLIVHAPSHF